MSDPAMATPRLLRRQADDFLLPSPKRSPLVKPGPYIGVSTAAKKHSYKGMRSYLLVSFDLWASAEALGNGEVPVARGVPYFINLDGVGPRSKYSRFLALFFPDRPQGERLEISVLLGKGAEVTVETVMLDAAQESLPEELRYSRVSKVIARV